jgi:predicted metalloprotease
MTGLIRPIQYDSDMRWKRSTSSQVTDRRGDGEPGGFGGRTGLGGGGIPIPTGAGGLSGITGLIVLAIIVLIFVFGGGGGLGDANLGGGDPNNGAASSLDPNDDVAQFINAVTVDIQTFWDVRFREDGKDYTETTVVLFTDATNTGCGTASSSTGPFYCSLDDHIYLDTSFFEELRARFEAPGDFAQAYVIAHEFGHHVQDELGILESVDQQRASNPDLANELSVRLELQADCLAGIWANSVWNDPDNENVQSITQEDVQEGLTAASSVGDDRIQEKTTGRIDPESFTHGTSEQRMRWFQAGFDQGTIEACDTFSADTL